MFGIFIENFVIYFFFFIFGELFYIVYIEWCIGVVGVGDGGIVVVSVVLFLVGMFGCLVVLVVGIVYYFIEIFIKVVRKFIVYYWFCC